jgi:hypothetical protein
MYFNQIFLTQEQMRDLLDLLNNQRELPESLVDIKYQIEDLRNSAK